MEQQTNPQTGPEATQTVRPTKKQRELLTFIAEFIAEHGYSPSYREIMNGLNYTSVATVALHVGNLIKRGHIKKRDRSARSLEVVTTDIVESSKIKTNLIKPSEEKWLLEKVDYLFTSAENEAVITPETADNLAALIRALQLLGIEAGSQQFEQRLRQRIAAQDSQK